MTSFFTDEETEGLQQKLIDMLNVARAAAGVPFIITSGYRDPAQNQSVGGVQDSSHEKGLAVDIRAGEDEVTKRIAFGLGKAGFRRLGIYDKHFHVDCDEEKPQDVIWTGISH